MPDQTLNVPSLFLVVLVTSLAIRYFFFSPRSSVSPRGRQVDPAQVDQIATMFPQADRRAIQWDLQRNGGSVAATTERMLSRGFLDTPPPSFQPQLPPLSNPPAAAASPVKPSLPDLITRYNLKSKISDSNELEGEGASVKGPVWSNNRDERQELLKQRREEMILKARRRMEDKERTPAP
ncbi:MAG: hypothetical protein Q9191_001510 [Dirinaria sp. TL-2023a]